MGVAVVGPTNVQIDVAPAVLIAGSKATMTCKAYNASPPADVSWMTTSSDGRVETRLVIAAVRELRTAAEHGGSTVESRVKVLLDSDDDGKTVMCLANGTRTLTSKFQLHVQCKSLNCDLACSTS